MNLMLKAPVSTRFVGFEETSIADPTFATENCAKIHAFGSLMFLEILVMYAKNAVPERMTVSLPMKAVKAKKKT